MAKCPQEPLKGSHSQKKTFLSCYLWVVLLHPSLPVALSCAQSWSVLTATNYPQFYTFYFRQQNVEILVTMPFCCPCLFTLKMEQGETKWCPVGHIGTKYIFPWLHSSRVALPPSTHQVHLLLLGWWILSLTARLWAKEPERTGWQAYLKV